VYVLAITLLSLVAFLPVVHECVYASLEESNTPKITQPALLSLLVTNNPIDRGNRQTVTAEVFDPQSKQGISGVNIKGTVTYASLLPIYEFNGKTDGNGNFSYSWTIDRDAEPGTFIVVVAATSEQHSLRLVEATSFEAV
jgi:phosphatidate phosphatase APP1